MYCCLVSIAVSCRVTAVGQTYHAERPGAGIVDDQPSLFLEPIESFSCPDTPKSGQRVQHVLHDDHSDSGEDDSPQQYKGKIVCSTTIQASLWIVVGHVKKLVGSTSGAGEEGVRQDKESEKVDGNAWLRSALKGVAAALHSWGSGIPI
jgi:hypothetical protein